MRTLSAQAAAVAATTAATPLQVRGRFFTAVALQIAGPTDDAFYEALDARIAQSPQFFADAPIAIDLAEAEGLDEAEAFAGLLAALRSRGLTPIGVQHPSPAQAAIAAEAGLIVLQGGRDAPAERREPQRPVAVPAPAAAPEPAPTLVITEPVRSGQCIVAERSDLVVVAPVSSGAELIAHGSIHVYGRLRGRALAGVHGDRTARIFCQRLDADLIAVAGLYRTNEALVDAGLAGRRVQAFLRDDTLCIEQLR
ncbi:MAG: septum site-determining protein MinC [Pseudomonadota bacterium]